MEESALSRGNVGRRRHLLHLSGQTDNGIDGIQENGTNHTEKNGSQDWWKEQRLQTLSSHGDVFSHIRVQTSANVAHATGCEDRSPHSTHHRRTFSRVPAHVTVAQDFLPTRVTLVQVHDEFVCLSPHFSKVILSSRVSSQPAWSSDHNW